MNPPSPILPPYAPSRRTVVHEIYGELLKLPFSRRFPQKLHPGVQKSKIPLVEQNESIDKAIPLIRSDQVD